MDTLSKIIRLTGATALSSISPLVASSCDDQSGKNPEKPLNIVYIMCDDHSYQTISAYDGRFLETPNIDRLADEGARFTNSFVANSLSGPSRACLLTGKHSHKNGFTNNEHGIFDGSQQTVQQLLRDARYTTAMVGKWHLVSEPTGFDYWNILTGQGDYYNPIFLENGGRKVHPGYATNVTTDLALDWLENGRDKSKPFCLFLHHKAPHRSWMPDLCDLDLYNDVTYPLPANFYDDYAGRVAGANQEMSIIKDMNVIYDLKMADPEGEIHTPENPALESYGRDLYLQKEGAGFRPGRMTPEQQAVWDAHYGPVIEQFKKDSLSGNALAEWKYQRYMRDYCRVIHSIDRNVGRVYDYLKENGLLENTIVIYTSDQGFYMGEHGYFDKRFMYEESFRTPLLVRMPDCMKTSVRGKDIDGFVQNIDHAPTFLELAGADIPDDIQGESYARLLRGDDRGWRKSLYYHYYEYPAEHSVRRHYGVRTERWSLMHFYSDIDEWELFDLKNDPQQMHNIWGKPGTEKITEKLMKELERLQLKYDDPIIEKNKPSDDLGMLVGTYTEGNGSSGVYLYEFNENDASYALLDTARAGNPSFIIPSADRKHAYSVGEYDDGRQGAYSYTLTGTSIDMLNFRSSNGEASGAAPCNVLSAAGSIITSNYNGGTVSAFPILEDGSIGDLSMQYVPDNDDRSLVSHIHCATPSPDGKYVFVTDLGLDALYRFTAGDASCPLKDAGIAYQFDRKMHPGPRHMVFSPDGRFAYVIGEVGDYISTFSYSDGKLEHLSTALAYDGEGHGSADIHISPDGRFLYTSHRLKEDGISVFSINPQDGSLKRTSYCNTGKHPRNFAITPNGKYLLCACRDSGCIEIYGVDGADGSLSDTGIKIELPAPVCVQFYVR